MSLRTDIYSVASVRKIDRAVIDAGIASGYTLMTRAGQFSFDLIRQRFPDATRWQVVCGAGNNGGDGYVVARLAMEAGLAVSVIALTPIDELAGDAATAAMDYAASGGPVMAFTDALDSGADLLIDALLGSGLTRDVDGDYKRVIEAMNLHPAPIIAMDVPSGLDADSGRVMGCAVQAAVTVTFVAQTPGLFVGDAAEHVGDIHFSPLDIPESAVSHEVPLLRRIDNEQISQHLGPRNRAAHKGDFGHVLVVGGAPGMPGAVRICGEAALRVGAGSVTVATHPDHSQTICTERPELMCLGVENEADVLALAEKASVIAIGPGLGTNAWSKSLLDAVLTTELPLVVDADALNLLADLGERRGNWVLTPHPGEAARLLEKSTSAIQDDRLGSLQALKEQYKGTAVLKGAGTLVSAADGPPWLCSAGNPGMAAPGMGDALTGIVAGLCGQGLSLEHAAVVGVQIHAQSGDLAATKGERGLLVSDLLAAIRSVVNP